MFEAQLESDLKAIFQVNKVTYDQISESQEQECLFVEVESPTVRVKENLATARVAGKLRVFVQAEKMPFGFFAKRIEEAEPDLKKKFFFHDVEENAKTRGNICERSISFVYFFSGQYNPASGLMAGADIEQVSE